MKKIAADLIATEMFKIMKKASEDNAAVHVNVAGKADVKENHAEDEDHAEDEADYADDEDSVDDLHEYLMSSADDVDDDASYVDDEIETMRDHSEDNLMRRFDGSQSMSDADNAMDLTAKASDVRLMQGLGKIEASLRRKGEGFAADLVRSTALSIQDDIVKEASQKSYVVKNLVKMASELDRKGEKEAAMMVKSTIMKINR